MAHPYASQAQASQKARLKRLGGSAGKAHGSSSMYKKKSYPSGAGTQREYTISGGKAKSRPDRMADGGSVRKKRKPSATTNIIISHAGGRGGTGGGGAGPVPVPVNRPVPVPVGGAPAGPGPQFAGPVRPPVAGPPPAAPPPVAPMRPPMPMPGGPPPVRPPGMKAGGAVKKAANGGFLKEDKGKAYKGYPNSPTTEVSSAVSAHKKGGGIKKLQFGGGAGPLATGASPGTTQGQGLVGLLGSAAPGRGPLPAQRGAPTISGVNQLQSQPLTVPQPKLAASFLQRPAPGTTTTFNKGGVVKTPVTNASGGGAGGKARLKKTSAAKSVPAKTESGSPSPGHNPPTKGMTGSIYHQQGKGR